MTEVWLKTIINIICSQFAVLMFAKIENKKENNHHDYRLFKIMLLTIIVLLLLHSLTLFTNGSKEAPGKIILQASVFLLFPAAGFLAMIYAIYMEKIIKTVKRRFRYWLFLYTIPLIIITGLCVASEFTHWFFTFDDEGYFHQGRFFYIPIIISFGYVITALFRVISQRKNMNIREYSDLVAMPVPMIVTGTLQSFFPEFPILLPGCVLTLFLVFSIIQDRRLSFDHLTGAYNRQKLDEYLELMSGNSTASGKNFAAMLADVNKFKFINDTYGHLQGDLALIEVVKTIRSGIRNIDFLARYAGDEFVVIFPDCNEQQLNSIISRINQNFSLIAAKNTKYKLSISIGADVYNHEVFKNPEHFIEHLDALMYKSKHKN